MDWVYLEHPDTKGTTQVPDQPGVVEWHESRGWKRAGEPKAEPFTPPKDAPPAEDGWVQLVHPDLPGVSTAWPDNPEALQGAHEAGWRYPKPEPDAEPESESKPAKKAPAKKAAEPATDEKE